MIERRLIFQPIIETPLSVQRRCACGHKEPKTRQRCSCQPREWALVHHESPHGLEGRNHLRLQIERWVNNDLGSDETYQVGILYLTVEDAADGTPFAYADRPWVLSAYRRMAAFVTMQLHFLDYRARAGSVQVYTHEGDACYVALYSFPYGDFEIAKFGQPTLRGIALDA